MAREKRKACMETISDRKRILSWAFYDWANSAFATTVMAGFFPLFFKQYWSAGTTATVSTFQLGAANSAASIIVAFLAPILGAIADRAGTRKKFLLYFAAMGIVMTGALPFVAAGNWEAAIALYIFATIGFSGGNIFYDALIVTVAPKEQMDSVSALGFALGYLGGGLLFALNIAMTLTPRTFGLNDANEAVRLSFISVAVWWAIFSIPLLAFVPEPQNNTPGPRRNPVSAGFQQLKTTFKMVRRLRVVCLFLLGYWLYIDGLDTIVRMAVDYGMSLGFASKDLITALLITQFVGFPAAMAFGWIGEKLGAKTGIFMGIIVYLGVTLWGFFMQSVWEFYLIAAVIGLVQGGVQSLSRSFYTRIIPKSQSAEFFGFYNLLGKFAAVIGPLLMGWVGMLTGNARYSILSISILFLCGGAFLAFVNEDEGRRLAEQMERRSFDSCVGDP
jgi:MFS transporter, UMF1 family